MTPFAVNAILVIVEMSMLVTVREVVVGVEAEALIVPS